MTRPNTDDIKWSAVRQSRRHRCRTDGWVFLIAIDAIVVQTQQFGHRGRYQSCCLRHDTQTPSATLQTASPAMTSMDKRVPDQVVRGSSVALPSGLWRSPTHPGIRHAAKPWEDGMVAIGPLFRARRRHAQVPGPIASRRSPYALGPASRVPLCGAIRPMVLSWTKVFLPISRTPRR
jgi:hypothetical protein